MTNKSAPIKSISQQVRWQLTILGCVLFLTSLLLLALFSFQAIESTTKNLVQLESETIVRKSLENPELPLPLTDTQGAYRRWSDVPAVVRRLFIAADINNAPPASAELLEAKRFREDGKLEYFYLLHHFDEQFGDLFLLSRHDEQEIEMITTRFFSATMRQSFWSTFIIFTLLFFLIRWLIQRTSEPLILLNRWAVDLGENNALPLKEDFPIQELNQLAAQLREGMDKIETYNRREREFLRYASHELRTPLGIIQASLDTLELQAQGESAPINRALKASKNVRQLSSALLWLARESGRTIKKSTTDIAELTTQIIDDHCYLLQDKRVDIHVNKTIDIILIEEGLYSIVFSNLIRNAFQYCADGDIDIILSEKSLKISNPYYVAEETASEALVQSFGIGLQLVQRICQKLSWRFDFQENFDSVSVVVSW